MEDLEGFLMGEGLDILQGYPELEQNSFSSSLDARWNGPISDLGGNDLNLFSLLKEGDSAHHQHSSSIGSTHQNGEQQQQQQQEQEAEQQQQREQEAEQQQQQQREQEAEQQQQQQQEQEAEQQQEQQQQEQEAEQQKEVNGFLELDVFDSEFSLLEEDGSTLRPSSSVGSINQMEQLQQQSNDEEEAEEEESDTDDKKANAHNSKNLISERNRRKRLNQQLFSLRSLVPNITKMDKRSILVDALAYLQSVLQQIEREKENTNITEDSSCDDDSLVVQEEIPPMQPQELFPCDSPPAISQIEVEKFDEDRFVLKIGCNRGMGALSQVQRVIESLGLEIISNSVNQIDRDHVLTTAFLRVKKKGVVTEEKLKNRVKTMALKLGLLLPNPPIH